MFVFGYLSLFMTVGMFHINTLVDTLGYLLAIYTTKARRPHISGTIVATKTSTETY